MTTDTPPTLLWLRRDLRLADHPGWHRALVAGGPVIPVFLRDGLVDSIGAAPKWRLRESLADLTARLRARGSDLVLRTGDALTCLRALAAETGAKRVVWSRLYDPRAIARDSAIKAALKEDGLEVESVNASLLFEPWTVDTKTGGFYKVFTPFWKAVRASGLAEPLAEPGDLAAPQSWPASERLEGWRLGGAMGRGAEIVARFALVGETAARDRLETFIADRAAAYKVERDRTDLPATSKLAENLTHGEISPLTVWHAGRAAMERLTGAGVDGAETFVQEVVWREFSYHLLYHTPQIESENWRGDWDAFPWAGDSEAAERWRRGMTGVPMVDAGMREMYVTGTMHNRVRMLVASFLTKHLLTHWKIGEAWFRDCLIDWDVAANAMGWQWAAGSGPDATPYFRVFNPATQAEKFDPRSAYRDRWLAEGKANPHPDALAYFAAVPRAWGLDPAAPPPEPIIGLAEGRARALDAYNQHRLAS
ncbi:MAG: deoxyribodipyrimidine photo-lyase [Pseudomonadota bacterium]